MRKIRNAAVLSVCLLVVSALFLGLVLPGLSAAAEDEKLQGKTVNINKGTADELATIPMVTPELAKAIVKYREENGDFQSLEELLQVKGFSRDLFNKIKSFLLLEGLGGDACTC
jgi:competence ComEA-like helix-hairpin-helix protein